MAAGPSGESGKGAWAYKGGDRSTRTGQVYSRNTVTLLNLPCSIAPAGRCPGCCFRTDAGAAPWRKTEPALRRAVPRSEIEWSWQRKRTKRLTREGPRQWKHQPQQRQHNDPCHGQAKSSSPQVHTGRRDPHRHRRHALRATAGPFAMRLHAAMQPGPAHAVRAPGHARWRPAARQAGPAPAAGAAMYACRESPALSDRRASAFARGAIAPLW